MITQELFDACEFAKTAADMSIPVEPMPTPEPGSEAIEGMVNGSMMDPNSIGAGTYAGAVDQAALAQAKARAAAAAQAAAAQKTAAVEEAFEMGYFDAYADYDEYEAFDKIASVEEAYEYGYMAAMDELEKLAAEGFFVDARGNVHMINEPGVKTTGAKEIKRVMDYNRKRPTSGPRGSMSDTKKIVDQMAKRDARYNKVKAPGQASKAVASYMNGRPRQVMTGAGQFVGGRGINSEVRNKKVMDAIGGGLSRAGNAVRSNKTAILAALGGAGAAGAAAIGSNMLASRRRAKLMRRAGIGGAALAGLAGLGYAAHKARD